MDTQVINKITLTYKDQHNEISISEKNIDHLNMEEFRDLCARLAAAQGYHSKGIREYFYADEEYIEIVSEMRAEIDALQEKLNESL